MNTVALALKVIVAVAIAVLLLVGVVFLAGEATVAWYMNHYGVSARIELAEDYGFGMLTLFVWCASGLIALPFVAFGAWRMSGRLQRILLANPLFQRIASSGR